METAERHLGATLLRAAVAAVALTALTAPPARSDPFAASAVPRLDGATKRKAKATLRRGSTLGARANVFAKVGDSISESPAFFQELGCSLRSRSIGSGLRSAVSYFTARPLRGRSSDCRQVNSFSRNSAATFRFTVSGWALQPGGSADPSCHAGETPLGCEIRLDRPAYAVILFGTNDVTVAQAFQSDPLPEYIANMGEIVSRTLRRGVVPILTTVPPRTETGAESLTEELNAGLYQLASERHVPLIDLWRALDPLPNLGLSADDVHPSLYGGPGCTALCDPKACAPRCQSANFRPAGLRYGYNVRNLITLKMLRRLSALAAPRDR